MTSEGATWYSVASADLDQGDILTGCQIIVAGGASSGDGGSLRSPAARLQVMDVLVMTQTCDVVQNKVSDLVVCPVTSVARFAMQEKQFADALTKTCRTLNKPLPAATDPDFEAKAWELIRSTGLVRSWVNSVLKLERAAYVMLDEHAGVPSLPMSFVSFHHIYSVPRSTLCEHVTARRQHLRLNSPYKEHVSQAFGRYFSRIGLPQDIAHVR